MPNIDIDPSSVAYELLKGVAEAYNKGGYDAMTKALEVGAIMVAQFRETPSGYRAQRATQRRNAINSRTAEESVPTGGNDCIDDTKPTALPGA